MRKELDGAKERGEHRRLGSLGFSGHSARRCVARPVLADRRGCGGGFAGDARRGPGGTPNLTCPPTRRLGSAPAPRGPGSGPTRVRVRGARLPLLTPVGRPAVPAGALAGSGGRLAGWLGGKRRPGGVGRRRGVVV